MRNYQSPEISLVPLCTEQTVLTGSHEIIPVVPADPGFTYHYFEEE